MKKQWMYWVICALTFTFLIGAAPGNSYARDGYPAGDSGQISYGSNEVYQSFDNYPAGYPGQVANAQHDKEITLTYFGAITSDDTGIVPDPCETEAYKELEKRTNIRLNVIHANPDSEICYQKLMIMLAAGDLPDIVEVPWRQYPGLLELITQPGGFIKLDRLIENNAPNYNELLKSNIDIRRQVTSDDGHIYVFPVLRTVMNPVEYGLFIRADLLAKLGLTVPETIDEWEIMLTLFKEAGDCDIPLSFDLKTLEESYSFLGAFGVGRDFCVNGGRVLYGPIQESYRDFLEVFSRWYNERLIDPEFILLNKMQLLNKVKNGDVGAFVGNVNDIKEVMDSIKSEGKEYDWIPAKNPVLKRGDTLHVYSRKWEAEPFGGAAISYTNKYPEETVKWLDYAYGAEGLKVSSFGLHSDPAIDPGYAYEEQYEAEKVWAGNVDPAASGLLPPVSLTREENTEVSLIMQDLYMYTLEMSAKYILGMESPDNFDRYAAKARMLGADHVTAIMQKSLYRYNNRLEEDRIKVTVNGKPLKMDSNPIVMDGKTLLPIRFVVEALGGSIEWHGETAIVTAQWNDKKMRLKIGSTVAVANNSLIKLGIETILFNDRTYVPLKFIGDSLGVSVDYNAQTKTVKIDSE